MALSEREEYYANLGVPDPLLETSTNTEERGAFEGLGKAFSFGADESLEMAAEGLKFFGAEGTAKWVKEITDAPENYESATQKFIGQNDDIWFDYDWSEGPRFLMEGAGQLMGNVALRMTGGAVGAAITKNPYGAAAGALIAPAAFNFLRVVGSTMTDRLERDGRAGQDPTWGDWLAVAPAAGVSGLLDSIGVQNLGKLNKFYSSWQKRVLTAGAREGLTETAQSVIEETGAAVGTVEGFRSPQQIIETAVAEGLVGGTLGAGFQGTVETGAAVLGGAPEAVPTTNQPDPNWRENTQVIVDEKVQTKLQEINDQNPTPLKEMSPVELAEVIKSIGHKHSILPGEKSESVYDKLVGFINQDAIMEQALIQAKKDVLSYVDDDRLLREEKEKLDNMSSEEYADYIKQQYGPEATPGQYPKTRVARINADTQIEYLKTDSIRNIGGPKRREFEAELKEKFSQEELFNFVQRKGFSNRPENTNINPKTGKNKLVRILVENMANAELQRERLKDKPLQETPLFWATAYDEDGALTPASLEEQQGRFLNDLLDDDGNALSAQLLIVDQNIKKKSNMVDQARKRSVRFERTGAIDLDENASIEERIQSGRGELVLAPDVLQSDTAKAWLIKTRGENTTNAQKYAVGQPLRSFIPGSAVVDSTKITLSSLPHLNQGKDALASTMSLLAKQSRPSVPLGNIGARLLREQIGKQRSLESESKWLAEDIDKAILTSKQKGEIKTIKEGERKFMAFLRSTGTQIDLTEEEKAHVQELQDVYRQELNDPDPTGSATFNMTPAQLEHEIDLLEDIKQGAQKDTIALDQVPKSMQNIAVKSRATIDALTTRFIEEFNLPEEKIETLKSGLNSYAVHAYKMFETEMGYNPMLARWLKGTKAGKEAQKNIDRLIVELESTNRGDPNFTRETAKNLVNQVLQNRKSFNKAADVANLPEILKGGTSGNQVSFANPGELLASRRPLSPAMKKLLGEIDDPRIIVAQSVVRMAKMVELSSFFKQLIEINKRPGEMMFSPKETGHLNQQIAPDPYNPLGGYWTSSEIAKELGIVKNNITETEDAAAWIFYETMFMIPKGLTQFGLIVLSPSTQTRNFGGAGLMFSTAGYLSNNGWSETISAVREQLGWFNPYDADGNVTPESAKGRKFMQRAQQLGVSNTSVLLNEAMSLFNRIADSNITSLRHLVDALYFLKNQTPVGEAVTKPKGIPTRLAVGAVFAAPFLAGASVLGLPPVAAGLLGGAIGFFGAGNIINVAKDTYAAADDFFKMLAWGVDMIQIREALAELDQKSGLKNGLTDDMKLKVLLEYARRLTFKTGGSRYRAKLTQKSSIRSKTGYSSDLSKILQNTLSVDEAIEEISAYHVRQKIPNYDHIGRFATWARRLPIGNFIAFPTLIASTSANIAQIGTKQMQFSLSNELMEEAKLAKEGIAYRLDDGTEIVKPKNVRPMRGIGQRAIFLGIFSSIGIPLIIKEGLKALNDLDDEDLEAAAVVGPKYARNHEIAGVSPLKDTKITLLNLSYYFPYTGVSQMKETLINEMRRGEFDDEAAAISITKGLIKWAAEYSSSYTEVSIGPEVMIQLYNNKDANGKTIYNLKDTAAAQFGSMLTHILDKAGPGGLNQYGKIARAFAKGDERFDDYGNTVSKMEAIGRLAGIVLTESDANKSIDFRVGTFISDFEKYAESMMRDTKIHQGPMTEEQIIADYDTANRIWLGLQKDFYYQYLAYKHMGMTRRTFRKAIKRLTNQGGIYASTAINLEKGTFTPWKLPQSVVDGFNRNTKRMKATQKKEGRDTRDIKRTFPRSEINARYRQLKRAKIKLYGDEPFPE